MHRDAARLGGTPRVLRVVYERFRQNTSAAWSLLSEGCNEWVLTFPSVRLLARVTGMATSANKTDSQQQEGGGSTYASNNAADNDSAPVCV